MGQMDGSVAVVTGAGRGIGRAIALKYAQEGADVVVVSRTQENSEKVAAEIRALGRKAWALAVDVADSAAVSAAAVEGKARFVMGTETQSPTSVASKPKDAGLYTSFTLLVIEFVPSLSLRIFRTMLVIPETS